MNYKLEIYMVLVFVAFSVAGSYFAIMSSKANSKGERRLARDYKNMALITLATAVFTLCVALFVFIKITPYVGRK